MRPSPCDSADLLPDPPRLLRPGCGAGRGRAKVTGVHSLRNPLTAPEVRR
ncbi:hypothetical protein ACFFX0_13425 [Citricoccus parietis]|uniref:Uncharacterized protein n=1 Tax=Citricoccus parietis TaxID=592307 RepID=A0ABV5FZP0_9MICC